MEPSFQPTSDSKQPSSALRILHLEDSANDAELISEILTRNWPDCSIQLVTDHDGFSSALEAGDFDLILSDCSMPTISGMEALTLARRKCPQKRFIFVSGHMGEDNAVEALKVGATDYVLKERLTRLPQAVGRAWREMVEEQKRQAAENAFKESETRFRTIVEQSLVGIYIIQGNQFIYVNPALSQIFGYSEQELISRPLLDLVAPEDKEAVRENVRKRMEGLQKAIRYQLKIVKKDQSFGFVEVHGTQIEMEGRPAIMGMMIDVTERAQAEERNRAQAAYLDNARDAIYVRDMEQRIIYWNKGAERIYGWGAGEVLGEQASQLLYKEVTPQLQEIRQTVVEKGEWAGELHQMRKDGQEVIVQSRRTLLRSKAGAPSGTLNINTDVTEQKKLENQFLRIQRMESIGTLAGGIAHDLNNILSPILMSIQLLRMKSQDPDLGKILDTVETCGERGANLVRQILAFSRGAEGERKEVQLKHLILEQVKISKDTFPRSITVQTKGLHQLFPVQGDSTQLYQVLMNLCVNARDAMPNGGVLTIEAENLELDEHAASVHIEAKPGPYVLLTVTDTGSGITPEIMERIFDPFFTTKELNKGTGLGLSTSIGIVKSHGGFMTVYSEVGKGTSFKVYLPACSKGLQCNNGAEVPAVPKGNGEMVLVVDDELPIRDMTKQILIANGYECVTAQDGEDALAVYGANRALVQIAIVDMAMPLMDGPTTIRALKRLNPTLKIIAVSGMHANAKLIQTNEDDTIIFLHKPFTTNKLLIALSNMLGKA